MKLVDARQPNYGSVLLWVSRKSIFAPRDHVSRVKEFDCYAALVNDSERNTTMVHARSRFAELAIAELNLRSGDTRSPGAIEE